MKTHLTEDKLWRGRLYPKGDRDIPADLAAALGLGASTHDEIAPPQTGNQLNEVELPSNDSGTPEPDTIPISDALLLLNTAITADDLKPLPSIGAGRGAKLLTKRPEYGYLSLDQAASMLGDKLVDWDAIAQWQFPEGEA